jgi:predicted ATPase
MGTLSKELRKLKKAWSKGGWTQHLEWLEIQGLRGWNGERVDFKFPLVAIVGENGVGKTTILQAAASLHRHHQRSFFASDFFPNTPWEQLTNVILQGSFREENNSIISSVRKPSTKWHGNPVRRLRHVRYLDLGRSHPIYAQAGYSKLLESAISEADSEDFDENRLKRFSSIVGKKMTRARLATTTANGREVPIVSIDSGEYSGFHQGAGEATIADIVTLDIPKYSIVLIDEIETSLHPRAQRRLIRDLAEICRLQKVQIILTTNSSYVLDELPLEARVQVLNSGGGKQVIPGISSEFAFMTMDEVASSSVDIYVEDEEAKILVEEILVKYEPALLNRVQIIPFGAASVGQTLGEMVQAKKFPRASVVILDADLDNSPGCLLLPGDDAPERVIFEDLDEQNWSFMAQKINRSHSTLVDNAKLAMTISEHGEWIRHVAENLAIGSQELWRAMCSIWVETCTTKNQVAEIIKTVREALKNK